MSLIEHAQFEHVIIRKSAMDCPIKNTLTYKLYGVSDLA